MKRQHPVVTTIIKCLMRICWLLGIWQHAEAMHDPFHPDMQVDGIACHPHSMDFDIQQENRQAVLWDIAHCAQWNIQLNTTITGTVSLQAKHLKPEQALSMVLDTQQLTWQHHGLWWKISDRHEHPHWHAYHLHHMDAKVLQTIWEQSQRATHAPHHVGMPDTMHNTWWLYCDDHGWQSIQPWLKAWDIPTPQIAIRATIMQVDAQTMASLGLILQSQSTQADHPSWTHAGADYINFGIAKLGLQQILTATLQAAASSGHGQMIASPHLLTRNHQAATIETGEQIPYTEKNMYGDSSTLFKKAVLKLAVTPHVLDKHRLVLDIALTQDQVNPLQDQQSPSIQTRSLKTQVQLQHGQTVILGGIEQQHHRAHQQHTPVLSHIPLLGKLFQQKQKQSQHQQLLLLITPTMWQNHTHSDLVLPVPSLFEGE